MILPNLKYSRLRTRRDILRWNGICYGTDAADGDLSESENLSARSWPALRPRSGRVWLTGLSAPTALCGGNALAVADGTDLIYDGAVVGQITPGDKHMAVVAGKLLVFPDKVYYDTVTGHFGPMSGEVTVTAALTESTVSAKDMTDLSAIFSPGQAVELSGCSEKANNGIFVIRSAAAEELGFYEGSFTPEDGVTLTIRRPIPDLCFLCEQGNRLWGVDSTTLYASALGDGLCFHTFDGLATDAYALSLGTADRFTGIAPYGGSVLVFEADRLHKVVGTLPEEYSLYTYNVPGVAPGAHRSAAVVNDVLYYKGTHGVYAYSGGRPTHVGAAFGDRRYTHAAGGGAGHLYYLSMTDGLTGADALYVLDTRNGVWLREDDTCCTQFTTVAGQLYALCDKGVFTTEGGEEEVQWTALLAPCDRTTPEGRRYTKLYVQADLTPKAWLRVEVRYDEGRWISVGTYRSHDRRGLVIPVLPHDCSRFQIRISGRGDCVLRQVTREYTEGALICVS